MEILCCCVPAGTLLLCVAGVGCLIVAEQRDHHRGWKVAAWLCFLVASLPVIAVAFVSGWR